MKPQIARKRVPFEPWDPYQDLTDLQNRLASLMPRYNGEDTPATNGLPVDWMPVVDISEDDHAFCIEAELPDVEKEDVTVAVEHGTLTISGERHQEHEEKKKKFHRVERSWGHYQRSFQLPDGVDADQVQAKFKNGVLRITIPKTEQHKKQTRTIPVQD